MQRYGLLCATIMIAGCMGNETEEYAPEPSDSEFPMGEGQSEDLELDAVEVDAFAKNTPEPSPLIRSEDGRIRYIIDFRDDAAKGEPSNGPSDSRFAHFHSRQTLNFVRSTENQHGIQAVSMTSLVGLSITAYLTEEQVKTLRADPKVQRISADQHVELSADALSLWTDSGSPEVTPWGKKAIKSSTTGSIGTARVYVLDAGVGKHEDLNVVQRVNAAQPTDSTEWKLVGCYPHATHVAGIIGAMVNNKGTQGVLPNAPIVSVSVLDPTSSGAQDTTNNCNKGSLTNATIIAGLDWIKSNVLQQAKVGVVNISMNTKDGTTPNEWSSTGTIGSKVKSLATPATGYPGALVVQSAGNYYKNACSYAYGPAVTSDAVLVTGAINDHAQPVVPLNGLPGFRNGTQAGSQAGSNYGACVELWAPGANVYSTWANNPQNASVSYSTYSNLSGTSMAAPHVAGLAARLFELYGATSSVALESGVRTALYALNSQDKTGLALSMPSANPPTGTSPRSTPYAEYAVSTSPFTPIWASSNNSGTLLSSNQVFPNGSVDTVSGAPTTYLSLDTWGTSASGCDAAYRLTTGGSNSSLGTGISNRYWSGLTWPTGNWSIYSNACPSAVASVSATPAPVVKWLVDNVDRTGQTLGVSVPSSAVIKFTSQYATSCTGGMSTDTTPGRFDGTPIQTSIAGLTGTYSLNPTPAHVSYWVSCSGPSSTTSANLTIVTAGLPTSGTWIDSAKPAWAWDLSRNDAGQVALAWYTFTASGNPTWYTAVLDPKNSINGSYYGNYEWSSWYDGTLNSCTWNGSAASCIPRGTVKFTPSGASAGRMDWTLDGATGTTNLSRFVFSGTPTSPNLTGQWYATSQSGWGESFDVQGNRMLAGILLYDAAGQPTWISSSYGTWNGTAYSTSLFRDFGINACPTCSGTQSVSSSQVGTVTVSSINGGVTTAALSLSFLAGSNLTHWNRSNLSITRLTK